MKLGSHDSLTGYSLRNWWVAPFNIFARTQTKNLQAQIDAGVMYFDLRFRRVSGKIYGAHGLNIYDITIEEVFEVLNTADRQLYIRALVEDGLTDDDLTVAELINEVSRLKGGNITVHRIGLKDKWGDHSIFTSIDSIGKNDYKLWEISDKLKELEEVSKMEFDQPTLYEVYSYEGLIPRVAAWFVNRKIKRLRFDPKLILFCDFV